MRFIDQTTDKENKTFSRQDPKQVQQSVIMKKSPTKNAKRNAKTPNMRNNCRAIRKSMDFKSQSLIPGDKKLSNH